MSFDPNVYSVLLKCMRCAPHRLIVGVGIATDYSVRIIVYEAVRHKQLDYEALALKAFGRKGFLAVVTAMFLFAFGGLLTYTIILADDISVVAAVWSGQEVSSWVRRGVILACSVGILLPLSLVRNMSSLAKTSGVSLLAVATVVIVVLIRAGTGAPDATMPEPGTDEEKLLMFAPRFFPALGAICFAFVCHHSSMVVFNSLQPKHTNQRTWRCVTHTSIAIAVGSCVVLSVAGYSTFAGLTDANLLNNYAPGDQLVNVTRVVFALTMLLTYPMEMFVARHCVLALMSHLGKDAQGGGSPVQHTPVAVPIASAAASPAAKHSGSGRAPPPSSGEGVSVAPPALPSASPSAVEQQALSAPAATGGADAGSSSAGATAPSTVARSVSTGGRVPWRTHAGITVSLWAVAMGIALVVEDLGLVLELTGGVSATIIGFVMPGLLQLKLTTFQLLPWRNSPATQCAAWKHLLPAYTLVVTGMIAFVVSTVTTIHSASTEE